MTNLLRAAVPSTPSQARNTKSRSAFLCALLLLVTGFATMGASAQVPSTKLADRITGAIDGTSRAAIPGSTSPRAMHSTDLGSIAPDTRFQGISLIFSRTPAQEADLSALLVAQQTPGSPSYHQWLTPAQFGARFGVSDNDLATTEAWLQSQGFTIDAVSPSRESITFSGSAASIESAFGAPIHYFRANSDTITHYAPAHDLTVPAALSSVVLGVANLTNYRAQSHAILKPAFTSVSTGNHFLTPKDVATIYDVNTAYNAGYTGLGQTIVVLGQSAVLSTDITNFQTAAGVPANTPNYILVPNSGSSVVNPNGSTSGDEGESDLDIEYASSIAYKATVDFVYTGNNSNLGIFQSLIYAVQQDLGTVITLSYGICEPDLGTSSFAYFESYLKQAAAQGQTVVNSSGDSGSTSCHGDGNTTTYQQQLAVSYPASSQYVTGIGGTEFASASVASGNNTYFSATNGSDVIGSALSYIPEQVWNDDSSTSGLSSGGGGTSILTARPSWQAGVTGITAGNYRLVPDISLDSSPNNAGYLYCSSDPNTGISGSCSTGFRAANGSSLTVAGGTSFAAPIFAGMLAIINQAKGYNSGAGLIQPTLYTLASNNATYALAFHDITSGGNQCTAGTTYCGTAGAGSYAATTGYDQASGLGSIDLAKLISVWPVSTNTTAGSTLTVTPNTTTPALNSTDSFSVTVSAKTGTGATPTGTVAITDNGNTVSGSPFTLTNGALIYAYTASSAGVHTLSFTYSGDSNYGTSRSTQIINVNNSSFTLSVTSPTISIGNSGQVTVTVTPVNGYTGTVQLYLGGTAATSTGVTIANTCFTNTPVSITIPAGTTAPVSSAYTVYTSTSACSGAGLVPFKATAPKAAAVRHASLEAPTSPAQKRNLPVLPAASFAGVLGLLAIGSIRRRSRALRGSIALGFIVMLGLTTLGLNGCSSGAAPNATTTTTTTTTAGAGTFNFVEYGNDSVDLAITAQTSFTVTLQ